VEEFPTSGTTDGEALQKYPVYKFTHSAAPPAVAAPGSKQRVSGAALGGQATGAPRAGIASCLVRQVTLTNKNACNISCRFRIEGPFLVQQISQVGHHPVVLQEQNEKTRRRPLKSDEQHAQTMSQLFILAKGETISLQVEFVPGMVPSALWTDHQIEHTFHGDVIIEYPRDGPIGGAPAADLQRIHLVATSRRPAARLTLVPSPELDRPVRLERAEHPPWAGPIPVMVDFGYVHVESSVLHKRVILISNQSNVVARWRLLHVGRKHKPPPEIGTVLREEEDMRALDVRDVFEFNVCEGELWGPTKDGRVAAKDGVTLLSKERQPHWYPVAACLPHGVPHSDDKQYEPQRVTISFRPQKNELYKCRFRIQVDAGLSADFICRGCGSYDEEDDVMDLQEA